MKRIEVSLFPVLLVLAYVLIEGSFNPLWLVGFSLIHELGHMLTIALLGGRVERFSGAGQGFSLSVNGLSYQGELLVAVAGPLTSFFLALLFWRYPYFRFANLALAGFNLVPILPLDGGRILRCILALFCEPHLRQMILQIVGMVFLLPLLGMAFWQFLSSGYNISLLFISFYLLFLIKENGYDV